MKKQVKIALVIVFAVIVGILVFVNRNNSVNSAENSIAIVVNGESENFEFSESNSDFAAFDAVMTKKNGESFDKNYGGIQLKNIFSQTGIEISENTRISVVCSDNYSVSLTAEEVLKDGNVWLVNQENGQPLSEDSGNFMLVITMDEFSTRWAKDIAQITVDEK